ncbi:hypothetical protein KFE25_000176 [Diacronema lutheri]|uniref:Pyridoxamine 5'-phosphate oxidase putative domain-containing protein n=1 Tax=Diacronema lutheri TaxID=2081491 RepID=A0A8J5XH46_DIALT|nr:hypothetical protein KFE25_000176 [Diacronema lutheri]
MGLAFEALEPKHVEFIARQRLYFVGSAPLDAAHHINVSPRSGPLAVVDSRTVAFGDLAGSGAETAAHVLQNGRMTIMLCNIEEGPPCILRLYGCARIALPAEAPAALLAALPSAITSDPGFRCVYVLHLERVQSSCGYSLPVLSFVRDRTILFEKAAQAGVDGMRTYVRTKNAYSIDGLPSIAQLGDGDAPLLRPVRVHGETLKPTLVPKAGFTYSEPATSLFDRLRARLCRVRLERGPGRRGAHAAGAWHGELGPHGAFVLGAIVGATSVVAALRLRK